ncbi:MAG TPA: nuclear transport factor 2 family protein [Acidimicrobiales bacterium]|nr:nuclear transport factor 2 family protein [Acidimicrobiales bacterium]
MGAQEDAELVRAGYDAFVKGDLRTVKSLLAPTIRWHIPGRSPISGTYEGIDAVLDFFVKLVTVSEGSFALELHDVAASDGHVVALVVESAERGERELVCNDAHVWHLENGRAVEFWACPADQYLFDEFWR